MGRPYARELALLSDTYAFVREYDVATICKTIFQLRRWPLLVVGSGGSLTAGQFAARLHANSAGRPASVLTPLEFVRQPVPDDTAVLLLSASGRNPDIIAAGRHAVAAECQTIATLVARLNSPLARELGRARHAHVVEVSGPAPPDGFLATNSLLLTTGLILRGYNTTLPARLPSLSEETSWSVSEAVVFLELLARRSIIALASSWALPAAADFESKWGESGLPPVTVLDPRNFAHGRHTGLARRRDSSMVVGLSAGEDRVLAETLQILPPGFERGTLQSPLAGPVGGLDLIVGIIQLTGTVTAMEGFDAGRPTVPAFGRRLYHARVRKKSLQKKHRHPVDLWVRRKVTSTIWNTASDLTREKWRDSAIAWVASLSATDFGAVVLDYDGTLCEEPERLTEPAQLVSETLVGLLRRGVRLGVATGRGKSAIKALRRMLPPELWGNVDVAMYNGAWLTKLDAEFAVDNEQTSSSALSAAAAELATNSLLVSIADLQVRAQQVTITERQAMPDGLLWRIVNEALARLPSHEFRIVASGSTVDVLDASTSKDLLLEHMRSHIGDRYEILTIGDQGQFAGNDHALLSHRFGLSVDRTSTDLRSCWNIAPVGTRRTGALLAYLRALHVNNNGRASLQVDRIRHPPGQRIGSGE